MTGLSRRLCLALFASCAASVLTGAAAAEDAAEAWQDIRALLFADRPIHDGAGLISLDAPERAHDAALVPITIRAEGPRSAERQITTLHLVIDQNPAPVAGVFHLTPASGEATIATRVRINEYTEVRAIAETGDGELHMVSRFVKASGGCSAPALKDHEQALARLGKMKLKSVTPFQAGVPNRAQLLISHPNYSGMQMDPLTRNWIPPHYVQKIEISYGERPVLTIEGDISLSENPSIHFTFVPDQPDELSVEVVDSEGRAFREQWPIGRPADS